MWRGAALAAAVALRAAALGRDDLSTDEIQTLGAVELPLGEMVGDLNERVGVLDLDHAD